MRSVSHPNVVDLRAYFYSKGDKVRSISSCTELAAKGRTRTDRSSVSGEQDEVYLNLVLECMPETLYAATRFYAKQKQSMPMIYVKVRSFIPPLPPTTSSTT